MDKHNLLDNHYLPSQDNKPILPWRNWFRAAFIICQAGFLLEAAIGYLIYESYTCIGFCYCTGYTPPMYTSLGNYTIGVVGLNSLLCYFLWRKSKQYSVGINSNIILISFILQAVILLLFFCLQKYSVHS